MKMETDINIKLNISFYIQPLADQAEICAHSTDLDEEE